MPPDLHVVQAALVAIAVAVWLHMLLLIAGLGILVKAWKATRDDLQHRFAELQTRIDQTTVAAQQTMAALDRCATQTSHILQVAERLASAIGALTTPPSWISTGSASRLVSRWRRRSKSTPTPET